MRIIYYFLFLFFSLATPFSYGKSLSKPGIYDDTYFLATYTTDINENVYRLANDSELSQLNNFEAKYQFSFSAPIIRITNRMSLMASYTQLSLWQLGNSEVSAPFRETNYQPQLFFMHKGNFILFNNIEYGYRHQSNGRGGEISRSWERFYLSLEKINRTVDYGIQGWLTTGLSDNDDIEEYIPPYSVWMKVYNSFGVYNVKFHQNFKTNRSGIELGYSHNINNILRLYFQVWTGYGETLIDYNHNQTRLGLGISIQPWN